MRAMKKLILITWIVLAVFPQSAYTGLSAINPVQESTHAPPGKTIESLIARLRKGNQPNRLDPSDYDALIWQVRQIGLQGERQRWKSLLDALHPEVLELVKTTSATRRGRFHLQAAVLTALGRLGNPESVVPLQHLKEHLDPYFRREVLPVVIARIHAVSQMPTPTNAAAWHKRVSLFLSEAGLSLSEAITDLNTYADRSRTWPPDNLLEAPRGVIALRVLAEMAGEAFANGVPDAFQLLEGLGKELVEKDYILWLRIQLGKRTTAERIPWLINCLLQDGVQTMEDRFLQQALVDCGVQVVPALVAKIEALEQGTQVSSTYRLHLDLLLETLSVFDEPMVFQTLERLSRHSDSYLSEAAQSYLARKRRGEKPTFVSWL